MGVVPVEGWSLRVDGTHEAWPIVGVLGCFDGGERWRPEGGGRLRQRERLRGVGGIEVCVCVSVKRESASFFSLPRDHAFVQCNRPRSIGHVSCSALCVHFGKWPKVVDGADGPETNIRAQSEGIGSFGCHARCN